MLPVFLLQALSQLAFRFDQVTLLCAEAFTLQTKYDLKVSTTSSSTSLLWEHTCSRARALVQLEFTDITWRSLGQPLRVTVDAIVGEVCHACAAVMSLIVSVRCASSNARGVCKFS